MQSILFVCTHNSARSQMAEGLMRHFYGDQFKVYSAGTQPGGVNPYAIKALAAIGLDISSHSSDSIDKYLTKELDFVITVCENARDNCPFIPAHIKNFHHSFKDPSQTTGSDSDKLAAFCRSRDEIKTWLDALARRLSNQYKH